MIEEIVKEDDTLVIDQEEYLEIVQLIYDNTDNDDLREEWLNYLQVATRQEAKNILFSLSR